MRDDRTEPARFAVLKCDCPAAPGCLPRRRQKSLICSGSRAHLGNVVDMASFSISSLLSTITLDTVTDGTGPIVVIRQHDNGILTVATDGNSTSARLGTNTTTLE